MILLKSGERVIDIVKSAEIVAGGLKVTREYNDKVVTYAQGANFEQVELLELPEIDLTKLNEYKYINGEFVKIAKAVISKFAFRQRMTIQEKAQLEMVDSLLEGETLATVKAVLKDFDLVEEVNLEDSSIAGFKAIMVQSGIFTQERVDEITAIQ
jgi:hypothetical protein